MSTNANNAGIGNKLVTIFARHRDNFFMTINFSLICQFFSGSGQILNSGTNYPSPGLAKIAPWCLAAGTVLRLKYRMTHRRAAPPTFTTATAGPLCLSHNAHLHMIIHYFAFRKFAKTVYEHHLQVLAIPSQTRSCSIYRDFKSNAKRHYSTALFNTFKLTYRNIFGFF